MLLSPGSHSDFDQEADKITLARKIVFHAVVTLLNSQGHKWPTDIRVTHCLLFCENPQLCLETMCMLNSATFLPAQVRPAGHDCEEAKDEVKSSRLALAHMPL